MRHVVWAIAAAVACGATSARADEPYAVTPSGRTEAVFDLAVVATSDRIANGCGDLGWTLVSSTSTMVVCEAQMNTLQSVLATLAIGNQYSTPPKQYLRFNIAGLQSGSRVQATGWIETQMAFGQVRSEEMSSSNYHNNVMDFFRAVGGQFPAGTTFPNHAYFGSAFEPAEESKGLRLTEIEANSPADLGGLQRGDVLTRLARERIKSSGDLLDGLRKAAKEPQYEVEIERNGQPMKVTLSRVFRPAAEGPILADAPADPGPALVQSVAAPSVADELAKFAKLRDDGIITADEFEAQKAKLLSQ